METLLYLSSVSLLIIIGVYIIWSLRDQSEDMYHDLKVLKNESEIKRLESEKAHIKETVKIEKSYNEEMRSCLEHIQELESKISKLGHVIGRQAEMIDLCSKSLDEAQERKDNEIRTKKGKRLIRRK